MEVKIKIIVTLEEIAFINFYPMLHESEKYFLEIKAAIRPLRRTTPELYTDFSKSVINEWFYLSELV
jgi:hypothetical protein